MSIFIHLNEYPTRGAQIFTMAKGNRICPLKNDINLSSIHIDVASGVKQAQSARKAVLRGTQSKGTRKVFTSARFHLPKTLKLSRVPKYARKAVNKDSSMDKFAVLKYPLNTESAMPKIENDNTLVFVCDVRANKQHIKAAVKEMYDVEVAKVNTLVRYGTMFMVL